MEEKVTILKRIAINLLTRLDGKSRKKAEQEVNAYDTTEKLSNSFTLNSEIDVVESIKKVCQLTDEETINLIENI